jgi:hypothetical protein
MVQILERKELEDLEKNEEVFVVVPEKEVIEEKIEEKKPEKKSRLFRKHKKVICIDKVKRNIDSKMYRNQFAMR